LAHFESVLERRTCLAKVRLPNVREYRNPDRICVHWVQIDGYSHRFDRRINIADLVAAPGEQGLGVRIAEIDGGRVLCRVSRLLKIAHVQISLSKCLENNGRPFQELRRALETDGGAGEIWETSEGVATPPPQVDIVGGYIQCHLAQVQR